MLRRIPSIQHATLSGLRLVGSVAAVVIALQNLGFAESGGGSSCSHDLTPEKQNDFTSYLASKLHIPAGTKLILEKAIILENCYRQLTFSASGPINTWHLTMYLSPDQRYLATELFDTTLDPLKEEKTAAAKVSSEISQNKNTSKGNENAQITIVEFSDFQCPYCKNLYQIIDELSPADRARVRLIFHHFPLTSHAWARTASEGAACAQLQGAAAFWAMHDRLFLHQSEITTDTVKEKLVEFARDIKSLNQEQFKECLDNDLSLGLVFKDMNLGSTLNINATPTLFINGRMVLGIRNVRELSQLIEE